MTDDQLREAIRVLRGFLAGRPSSKSDVYMQGTALLDYAEAKMGRTAENCDFGSACTRNVLVLRCDVPQTDAIKLACPCASWQPKEDTP